MDQNNPLAGLTHKRRLSALGFGWSGHVIVLVWKCVTFTRHTMVVCVRLKHLNDSNIGLIGSLAAFARINSFGFIETPYRVVRDSQVTDEVAYLTADDEDRHTIAQASSPVDKNGRFMTITFCVVLPVVNLH